MMPADFSCRSCGSRQGRMILDLGLQPLANNLPRLEDLRQPEPRFPLRLFVCEQCWLMQIADLVPPVDLFGEYLYFSSFSDTMLRHARQAVERYVAEYQLGPQSYVVEIASNDGYLLRNLLQRGIPCLGIEPARNIAKVARENGIETLEEFFGLALVREKLNQRRADLILANNVFAHAPNTNDFVAGLRELLKPGGRIVLEFPYGMDMVAHNEFDTIYHEHVYYFTLTALLPLFERHGLEIFDVEKLSIHGGSLRLFAGHSGAQTVRATVPAMLEAESRLGVKTFDYYQSFAHRVATIKAELIQLLAILKSEGKTLAAYGASAKGSTLLNYFGVGREHLEFVTDRSTYKQGRLTPGTHIPIVAPEMLCRRQPDYALLLTWNFADEILLQQQAYRKAGGRFIIPIPKVSVV